MRGGPGESACVLELKEVGQRRVKCRWMGSVHELYSWRYKMEFREGD